MEPVHIIIGKNEFLAQRHRRSIIDQARQAAAAAGQDPDGVSVSVVKAGEVSVGELAELVSPSLFGEDRVVVITNMAEAGKEPAGIVMDAVANPAPGVTMIVEHSGEGRQKSLVPKLVKLGVEYRADDLKASDLPAFVKAEFQQLGARVDRDTIGVLIESVGSDLRELAQAASQLVADNDGKVTVEAVRAYYTGAAEVSGFAIADDVLAGRVASAVAATRRALQLGEQPVLICSAVCRGVADVARIQTLGRVDPNRDAATLGMAPWKIRKVMPVASRWSAAAVAEAVQVAAEMEAGVKGQMADPAAAVELGVRRLAQLARA